MRKDLFPEMYKIEKSYWWYRAKREYVKLLVRKFLLKKKGLTFLDVGCGTGCLMEDLTVYGKPHGIDVSRAAVAYCKKRELKNLHAGMIEKAKYRDNKFDLITAMDVIEHIEKDRLALTRMRKMLKRNGIVILTVPAFPWLWSYWDEVAGHYRRYSRSQLCKLLEDAGFRVRFMRHTNALTFLPALVFRLIKGSQIKRKKVKVSEISSDFLPLPRFLNLILFYLMKIEGLISYWIGLPFGLSYIVVASKEDRGLFYEDNADKLDRIINNSEIERRVELVFNDLFAGEALRGKSFLDIGCGLGQFSAVARGRGAKVTGIEVGKALLALAQKRVAMKAVVGDALKLKFKNNSFDYVLCTEVIEHTKNPGKAIKEALRVLKPGGKIIITTPNKLWHFAISSASTFGVRKYQGIENWISINEFKKTFIGSGGKITKERGFNLFYPGLFRFIEDKTRVFDFLMVNYAILGTK